MTKSKAMAGETSRIPHIAKPGSELYDLRDDVDESFQRAEALTDWPRIVEVPGGNILSIGGSPVSSACVGVNLLQDKLQASLVINEGTTAELTFTAQRPGTDGNDITVQVVDSAGGGLAVSETAGVIEIDLGGATPDAATILAALDADADILNLIATAHDGVAGAGLPLIMAAALPLAGGTGDGFDVWVGGVLQTLNGPVTDTAMPLVVTTGTGMVIGDAMELLVVSDGVAAPIMTVDIVA